MKSDKCVLLVTYSMHRIYIDADSIIQAAAKPGSFALKIIFAIQPDAAGRTDARRRNAVNFKADVGL